MPSLYRLAFFTPPVFAERPRRGPIIEDFYTVAFFRPDFSTLEPALPDGVLRVKDTFELAFMFFLISPMSSVVPSAVIERVSAEGVGVSSRGRRGSVER